MLKLINNGGLPIIEVAGDGPISIIDILMCFGWAKSRGDAKRLIKQGSVRIYKNATDSHTTT